MLIIFVCVDICVESTIYIYYIHILLYNYYIYYIYVINVKQNKLFVSSNFFLLY